MPLSATRRQPHRDQPARVADRRDAVKRALHFLASKAGEVSRQSGRRRGHESWPGRLVTMPPPRRLRTPQQREKKKERGLLLAGLARGVARIARRLLRRERAFPICLRKALLASSASRSIFSASLASPVGDRFARSASSVPSLLFALLTGRGRGGARPLTGNKLGIAGRVLRPGALEQDLPGLGSSPGGLQNRYRDCSGLPILRAAAPLCFGLLAILRMEEALAQNRSTSGSPRPARRPQCRRSPVRATYDVVGWSRTASSLPAARMLVSCLPFSTG